MDKCKKKSFFSMPTDQNCILILLVVTQKQNNQVTCAYLTLT